MDNKKNERINQENYNNYGTLMKIVEYTNANDIIAEFQDKYKARVHGAYKEFKKGSIKNPFDKEVFGVAFCGVGDYKPTINGKITIEYRHWYDMIRRCYDPYRLNEFPTYIDCYVCDEWLNFQNFAKWFHEHYYEIEGEKMHLDKDILYKGNKIYSSENCIFVPERINYLFLQSNAIRGKCPIGVSYSKSANKYQASCNILDDNLKSKKIYLGLYKDKFEAFLTYKTFKEKHIKQVADEYKEFIPNKLYETMYEYKVEIDD